MPGLPAALRSSPITLQPLRRPGVAQPTSPRQGVWVMCVQGVDMPPQCSTGQSRQEALPGLSVPAERAHPGHRHAHSPLMRPWTRFCFRSILSGLPCPFSQGHGKALPVSSPKPPASCPLSVLGAAVSSLGCASWTASSVLSLRPHVPLPNNSSHCSGRPLSKMHAWSHHLPSLLGLKLPGPSMGLRGKAQTLSIP